MRQSAPLLALAAILLLAAGCGQGGTDSTHLEEAAARRAEERERRELATRVPNGASHLLRALYASFPPPKPDPIVRGSARGIGAGKRACAERTPLQVKRRYWAAAAPRLLAAQRRLVERLGRYERLSSRDRSFAAGQLAATVYAATLPEALARYGFQGCVYALARRLERRLEATRHR
ncbi:MAG TPA: hypothetical protein VNL97_05760 [Solirubrobacterales bacterium]|nr:hypothetical protein [Solirubrobacterales bacterium]